MPLPWPSPQAPPPSGAQPDPAWLAQEKDKVVTDLCAVCTRQTPLRGTSGAGTGGTVLAAARVLLPSQGAARGNPSTPCPFLPSRRQSCHLSGGCPMAARLCGPRCPGG